MANSGVDIFYGPPGPPGPPGQDGSDGVDGVDGVDGQNGQDGADGVDGADAPPVVTIGPNDPWPIGLPEGALVVRLAV
jgi:hypothetical protein